MQLTTTNPFLELFPYDVTREILIKAAHTLKEFIGMSLVSHKFLEVVSKTLSNTTRDCGYCSREQEMNSILLNLLNTASQKHNLRAKIPRPPIRRITLEESEESPVCHSLTITDFEKSKSLPCDVSQVSTKKRLPICHILIITDVDLEKPLICDASQVHTLLVSLTDKQHEDERFNKFDRVVNFFTINKFPNLRSLVLNNVNCTNELLECLQEYNLDYFHLRYFSWDNYIDPKSNKERYHLDKLATLSVKDLRIDILIRLESCDLTLYPPPNTRNLTLKIDVMGSIPKSGFQSDHLLILMPYIDIVATNSKSPLNVHLFCDPLYFGILTLNTPKEPCTKNFICYALPHQFCLNSTLYWDVEVVKLYMHADSMHGTTFPKCLSPKYYNPDEPTSDDEDYIRMFSDKEINYGNCELEMFLNQDDKNS